MTFNSSHISIKETNRFVKNIFYLKSASMNERACKLSETKFMFSIRIRKRKPLRKLQQNKSNGCKMNEEKSLFCMQNDYTSN